jgi:outer membrane protein TolC
MSLKKNRYNLKLLLAALLLTSLLSSKGWAQEKLNLTIKEAIEVALKNNPTILSTDYNVKIAQASLNVAIADTLPKLNFNLTTPTPTVVGNAPQTVTATVLGQEVKTTTEFEPTLSLGGNLSLSYLLPTAANFTVSLGASVSRSKASKVATDGKETTPDPTFTTRPSLSLRVDQPLFVDGFALARAALDQASANLAIAQSSRVKSGSDLAYNVAAAYYSLMRTRKLVGVSQEAVKQAEQSLAIAKEQAGLGAITEVDVKRSEVQLGSARNALITAQSGAIRAQNNFYDLLKLDPSVQVELTEEIGVEPVDVSLQEAIDRALAGRQEIVQAAERVRIAEATLTISSRESKPNLTVGGGYNLSGSGKDFGESINKVEWDNWNVSVGLTLPIYDGGRSLGSAEKALYDLEQAKIGLEAVKSGIVLEVRNVYQTIAEAESKIRVSSDNVALARENLAIDTQKFKVGGISSFQLSATELTFTNAQTDLVNATIDYNAAKANLAKAMGVKLVADR